MNHLIYTCTEALIHTPGDVGFLNRNQHRLGFVHSHMQHLPDEVRNTGNSVRAPRRHAGVPCDCLELPVHDTQQKGRRWSVLFREAGMRKGSGLPCLLVHSADIPCHPVGQHDIGPAFRKVLSGWHLQVRIPLQHLRL